jgi:hypothetical protein
MEPQLAEFVGLACLLSDSRRQGSGIGQTMLEKMIHVAAQALDCSFEFLNHRRYFFGVKNEVGPAAAPHYFYTPRAKGIEQFESNYFTRTTEYDRRTGTQTTTFFRSSGFDAEFPRLARADNFRQYEQCLRALLPLGDLPDGLSTLIFCSMTTERLAGVEQILADVEIMLGEATEYVRSTFHLTESRKRPNPKPVRKSIDEAYEGLKSKVKIARNAGVHRQRIERSPVSAHRELLLQRCRALPDTGLWDVLEWLGKRVHTIAKLLLEAPLPNDQLRFLGDAQEEEVLRELAHQVRLLAQPTQTDVLVSGNLSGRIVALTNCANAIAERWICTLGCILRRHEIRQAEADADPAKYGKQHAVCFDMKDSSKIKRQQLRGTDERSRFALAEALNQLRAIETNWPLLFHASLGPSTGDNQFALFDAPGPAVNAMSLALMHVGALQGRGHWDFPVAVRAGIGTAEVIKPVHVETLAVSNLYHCFEQQRLEEVGNLANEDHDQPKHVTTAVALGNFVQDHAQYREHCDPAFSFGEENAFPLRWREISQKFIASLS